MNLLEELAYLENLPRYNCFKAEDIIADQEIDKRIAEIESTLRKIGFVFLITGKGTREEPLNGEWREVKKMNRDELRAAIARKNISKVKLAEAMGLSYTALHYKMTGRTEFKESEIRTLVKILDLSAEELNHIFLI